MASTITIACPECDKEMKVPAEVLGKKIRCKGCGATFPAKGGAGQAAKPPAKKSAPAKPKAAAKPAKKAADDDEDASPYGVTEEKASLRCPNCANELESEEAVVCLYCGYNIITRERSRMKKVRDITGGDVFMWLLPGIICVIVVIALLTGDILYCLLLNEETIEKEEWYGFIASLGIKLWLVVMSLFIMFFCGKFAVKRLIFNNRPPEVEETY
jgi:DNA-directed RNA polymerase subunit RPC12/RpoP